MSVGENSIKNRSDILLLVFFRVHIFFSDTSCLRAITEMNKQIFLFFLKVLAQVRRERAGGRRGLQRGALRRAYARVAVISSFYFRRN